MIYYEGKVREEKEKEKSPAPTPRESNLQPLNHEESALPLRHNRVSYFSAASLSRLNVTPPGP